MIKEERLRILQELQNGIDNGTTADAGGILKAPVTDFTWPGQTTDLGRLIA